MNTPNGWQRSAARAAHLAAVAAALAGAPALAQDTAHPELRAVPVQALDLARLESMFWICDYLGTTRGADGADAPRCIAISDALRQRKFGNDLDRLVAWWRERKPAEHERLRSMDPAR